ncbi:MAG: hypothetical protein ACRBN8_22605 [Nannocystales bacterium]
MALPYSDTKVSVAKSRADISKLLEKSGVGGVQWTTWPDGRSVLRFEVEDQGTRHMVRLTVDPETQGQPVRRTTRNKDAHMKREANRLHRTLHWYVKSKLEAIEAGLEAPAQAWLPSIEGPRGHTVFEEMRAGLAQMVPGNPLTMPALPAASEEG